MCAQEHQNNIIRLCASLKPSRALRGAYRWSFYGYSRLQGHYVHNQMRQHHSIIQLSSSNQIQKLWSTIPIPIPIYTYTYTYTYM